MSTGVRKLPTSPASSERAIRYTRSKLCRGFYGTITLKIEDGFITHMREERSFIGTEIPSPQPDIQESSAVPIG